MAITDVPTAASPTASEHPVREIKTRRVKFGYERSEVRKYFAAGDPVMSHVVSTLSAMFPPGEDFFVRAVRNYRDTVTDPAMKKAVAGFIGQEAIHGREHRDLNELFGSLGYPTVAYERFIERALKFQERVTPKSRRLAVTAALEHYTATLAEVLMGDEEARNKLDPPVRNLLLWHALEESEHKAVAFDVYRNAGLSDLQRRIVMRVTTVGFVGLATVMTLISVALDGGSWRHPVRTLKSLANIRRSPWLSKRVRRLIGDYQRPDFHPDDHESDQLLEHWRGELFGADGTLTDRLAG